MGKVLTMRDTRPTKWAKARWDFLAAVLASADLNPMARLTAVALVVRFANHETAECKPGLPALMAAVGAPKRTVMKAIADQKATNWLAGECGSAPGIAATYRFLMPSRAADQLPRSERVQVQGTAPEEVHDVAQKGARSGSPPLHPL